MATTAVRFYTGLDDRLGFAARLLRKAGRQGVQAGVVGSDAELQRLSRQLWSLPGFQAHAGPGAPAGQRRRSPIVLLNDFEGTTGRALLVNLTDRLPPDIERWPQVIELIAESAEDVQRGRQQFKAYKARGLQPEHLAASNGGST